MMEGKRRDIDFLFVFVDGEASHHQSRHRSRVGLLI